MRFLLPFSYNHLISKAFWTLCFILLMVPLSVFSQVNENRLLSISHQIQGDSPQIIIETAQPVGYRYTVYESTDPRRIVLDFPGMNVGDVQTSIVIGKQPVGEVRTSSFDLSSGKLARVEILLDQAAEYDVDLNDTYININFSPTSVVMSEKPIDVTNVHETTDSEVPLPTSMSPAGATMLDREEASSGRVASLMKGIELDNGKALLKLDGKAKKIKYFSLDNPSRLVVDVFGVKGDFKEKEFEASMGFKKVRVGFYAEKTRVVFDAAAKNLPKYRVTEGPDLIEVAWGVGMSAVTENSVKEGKGEEVTVESIDFVSKGDAAVVSIALSGKANRIEPRLEGNIVRFGVRNAKLGRALRRTIDSSAFPSAVLRVTPYTVLSGEKQDVLFAVELKGSVAYELKGGEKTLLLTVENGPYAQSMPVPVETVEVEISEAQKSVTSSPEMIATPDVMTTKEAAPPPLFAPEEEVGRLSSPEKIYEGEKITLIFDQADVRQIFQLIGEVSGLNVILGEGVQGPVSLRLIDVPWDQALELIMDIKGLGMLRKGNIVQILPKDKVRAMRQEELKAASEEQKLEPLVTEVIGVSYTSLANVAGPVRELLTERGKLTKDDRNKQFIITDIPSIIEKAKELARILDTPEKQVMIEARIVEARANFTRQLGVSWGATYTDDSTTPDQWDVSKAAISGGGSFVISPIVGNAGIGSSITFGKLGTTSAVLDLKLSAAETTGDSKIVSKPRVTTLNGETATISQGTQIPYTSSGADGLPKTEFVDATLQLNVTPIINPDDSVILEISASNNTPTQVAGASAPAIDKKEAKTKVLVNDGETTVIGGIFVESESQSETGIPLLKDIPLLGYLFKSKRKNEDRNELLIFITPRILN